MKKRTIKHKEAWVTLVVLDSDEPTTLMFKGVERVLDGCYGGALFFNEGEPLDYLFVVRKSQSDKAFVHEFYHLWFKYLNDIDQEPFTAEELGREVYCYEFCEFYEKVRKAFDSLIGKIE